MTAELVRVQESPVWYWFEGMNGACRAAEARCLLAGLELLQEGSERRLVKVKPQMQGRPQNVNEPRAVESVKWNLAKSTGQGVCSTESRD